MQDVDRLRPGQSIFYLCAFVLVAALVLGGGTRNGFLSDAILQLLAVALLIASIWRYGALPAHNPARWPLVFCAVLALVPILQAVPLPPQIWTQLPSRQAEIEALELAGHGLPWMPLSVLPRATVLSALSLVVPIAVFLATTLLDQRSRGLLSLVVIAVGVASVFLGLSQIAQGPSSPLRFFDIQNTTEAIGFFANRNHYAALLYAATLLTAAWAVDASLTGGDDPQGRSYSGPTIVAIVATFTVLVLLVAAQVMARSRAGLALTIVALLGAYALALVDRRTAPGATPGRVLAAVVVLAAMFTTQFALYRVMERFAADPLQGGRIAFAHTTIEAARDFMPFGSGMGTFVPVYALFEKPENVMINTYANRAHNDVLELWLETGVVGMALLGIFLVWFGARAIAVWRHGTYGGRPIDGALARAATLIVGLIIAHSFVDYPLRTGAVMAVFAFACALLVPPPAAQRGERSSAARGTERAAHSQPDTGPPGPPVFPPWAPGGALGPPSGGGGMAWPSGERWGKDIEWPEAWREPAPHGRPKPRGSS